MYSLKTIGALFLLLMGAELSGQTFNLKSSSFSGQATQKMFLNGFGCQGDNISPQLCWEHPPTSTQSFAITIHDQNAPTDSGFWHWIVIDIPSSIHCLEENISGELTKISPHIIETKTDFGSLGYSGPCPPLGDNAHRYVLTVYALKVEKLGLSSDATPAIVSFYLNNNAIEKSSLVFYAKR